MHVENLLNINGNGQRVEWWIQKFLNWLIILIKWYIHTNKTSKSKVKIIIKLDRMMLWYPKASHLQCSPTTSSPTSLRQLREKLRHKFLCVMCFYMCLCLDLINSLLRKFIRMMIKQWNKFLYKYPFCIYMKHIKCQHIFWFKYLSKPCWKTV